MTTELVHLDVADRVATITLDSPHNRNALSRRLLTELAGRLRAAETDDAARVVLLRSADPVFCSGADLSEALTGDVEDGGRQVVALQAQIAALAKPVVVELRGAVRAGGLGLVAAADIVLAAESATFALTEVRLGLAPSVISLSLLERVPPRALADVILSARTFGAVEAARMGLVTRTVPDAELPDLVRTTLAEIARGNPQGLAAAKRLLNRALVARIERDGEQVARESAALFTSTAAQQAIQTFLRRSAPSPGRS
jgi:enoyl-CoA hydratase